LFNSAQLFAFNLRPCAIGVTLNQSFHARGVDVLSASPGCSTLFGSPPPARSPSSFQGS
jgi:hypothetical protein